MKYAIRCVASVGLAAFVTSARAQELCEIPQYNCGDIPYLLTDQTWILDPAWTPQRVPGVIFMLTNGSYCGTVHESNHRGLNQYWCDPVDDPNCELEGGANGLSGVQILEGYLNDAWGRGFRRFMLHAPAGTVWGGWLPDGSDPDTLPDLAGQEYLASSQWETILPSKRAELATMLGEWLDTHPEAWIEVYGSLPTMNNPGTRCLGPSMRYPEYYFPEDTVLATLGCVAGARVAGCPHAACAVFAPSPFVRDDVCAFEANVGPWRDLGIRRYWLDSASREAENYFANFIELAYCPLYRWDPGSPHLLGMESIPSNDLGPGGDLGPGVIDMVRATRAPALSFPNVLAGRDPEKVWDVSAHAATTELAVVLDWSEPYMNTATLAGVMDWARRGFVPYVVNPESAPSQRVMELVKRVFDFGIINRADFNGDGVVDAHDLADFNAAFQCHVGMTAGCNYAHGDMDHDNDVDLADNAKFLMYYSSGGGLLDLGPCTPTDAMDALTRSQKPGCS